jgi:hypothetical protein
MRIFAHPFVRRDHRTLMDSGGCNDDTIRGVPVVIFGQRVRFLHDFQADVDDPSPVSRDEVAKPALPMTIQGYS